MSHKIISSLVLYPSYNKSLVFVEMTLVVTSFHLTAHAVIMTSEIAYCAVNLGI